MLTTLEVTPPSTDVSRAKPSELKYVYRLDEPGAEDAAITGGKASSAAKLAQGGIPIPPAFAISRYVCDEFFESNGLLGRFTGQYKTIDTHNKHLVALRSERMMGWISSCQLSQSAQDAIDRAHAQVIGAHTEAAYRSSALGEDGVKAAFAGQYDSVLFVERKQAAEATRKVIASLHGERVIGYRAKRRMEQANASMPILVMKMVRSKMAGVMLTAHKVTGNKDQIYIEVVWGQGEGAVNGKITPDVYILDKHSGALVEHHVAKQEWKYDRVVRPDGSIVVDRVDILEERDQNRRKLTDGHLRILWHYAREIEDLYGGLPMDTEFAFEEATEDQRHAGLDNVVDGDIYYCTQARPITNLGGVSKSVNKTLSTFVRGIPGSPGAVAGVAQVIKRPEDLPLFVPGNILVMPETDIRAEPQMAMAKAVVTDVGGGASHAALTCAELGIPCVCGTGDATLAMESGKTYTVDGTLGLVFEGEVQAVLEAYAEEARMLEIKARGLKTLVEIAVNIGNPRLAPSVAQLYADAVGLARGEFILTNKIKIHPRWFIEHDNEEMFITALTRGFGEICSAFGSRPVLGRVLDPRVDEFKGLQLGQEYLPHNFNPAIGTHGAREAIYNRPQFLMEMKAYAELAKRHKNFGIMGAFYSFPYELEEVAWAAEEAGLDFKDPNFTAAMMWETAANGIAPRDFLDVAAECGYSYLSIGGNDATQGVLEVDRMQTEIQGSFSQSHPIMLGYHSTAILLGHEYGMKVGFCGDGINKDEVLFRHLIEKGIDSVSPSPPMVHKLRVDAAQIEAELVGATLEEYQEHFYELAPKLAKKQGKEMPKRLLHTNH